MSMSINPVDLAAAAEGILNTQYLLQRERRTLGRRRTLEGRGEKGKGDADPDHAGLLR